MMRSIGLAAVMVLSIVMMPGCRARPRSSDVTVHTTTRPVDREQPRGRHVELMLRDTTTSRLTDSIIGKECRVQFRRDALGMSSNIGVAPTHDYRGLTSINGRVADLNDQWVVVQQQNKRYVIPHGAILLIDVQD